MHHQRNSYPRPSLPPRGATVKPSSAFVSNRYIEGQRQQINRSHRRDQDFDNFRRQVNLQNDFDDRINDRTVNVISVINSLTISMTITDVQ